ncbi:MAG: glycosyl hydrolase [Chloroflexota bacterium]
MKKRIALFCVCLLSLNLLLAGFTYLSNPSEVQGADTSRLVASGRVIGAGEDSPFGLNIHAASRYAIPGQLQVPLDSAKGTGVAWNREEIRWNMVQQPNGNFDFSLVDEMVDKSLARGIHVLGLLVYNRDNSKTMPDITAWNNYVSNTVRHYQGKVSYWQVWNEPENNDYLNGANPADYARLLRASYATIKAANPNAKVLTAGVNGFAVPWLEKMVAAGGEGQYDILAVHPYVRFKTSPEAKYWADNQLAYLMAFNQRHGNKPVWATEFGWATAFDPEAVSESTQADYLARAYVTGLASGLSKLFIYQFHDEGTIDNYGLVRKDWTTTKPSYTVYSNLVTRLTNATYNVKVDLFDYSRQAIEDFENTPAWNPFTDGGASANVTISGDQVHGGSKGLKVNYGLTGGYIEMGRNTPAQLTGQPSKVGFWIYGDDSGALFKILIKGSDGQLFVYEPGKAGGKYWHRLEAFLKGENVYHNGDGVLRYPVSFQSIQITRQPDPDELQWNGTVYLDDFYAEEGVNAQVYRFDKSGRTMDVVWTDGGGANLSIPTQSSQGDVRAYNRDGGNVSFSVANGTINFAAGDEMLFFEHNASAIVTVTPPPAQTPCTPPTNVMSATTGFPNVAFQNFWGRYDALAPGNRSFVWGPQPYSTGTEPYAQSPGGSRQVLYFDKSRMEINNPTGDANAVGYVTNGLLTNELITGKIQRGDDQGNPQQFTQCLPAQIPVAGDLDDGAGPKYASFASRLKDSPKGVNAPITESIDGSGNLGTAPNAGQYNVVGGYFEPLTNHTIAKPFWNYLNDSNQKIAVNRTGKLFDPYYVAPGLPISEAYWARVKVGGQVKDVLIQAFERRVLTYTPSNSAAYQVEWGNIGRHYYFWRYGKNP